MNCKASLRLWLAGEIKDQKSVMTIRSLQAKGEEHLQKVIVSERKPRDGQWKKAKRWDLGNGSQALEAVFFLCSVLMVQFEIALCASKIEFHRRKPNSCLPEVSSSGKG